MDCCMVSDPPQIIIAAELESRLVKETKTHILVRLLFLLGCLLLLLLGRSCTASSSRSSSTSTPSGNGSQLLSSRSDQLEKSISILASHVPRPPHEPLGYPCPQVRKGAC